MSTLKVRFEYLKNNFRSFHELSPRMGGERWKVSGVKGAFFTLEDAIDARMEKDKRSMKEYAVIQAAKKSK